MRLAWVIGLVCGALTYLAFTSHGCDEPASGPGSCSYDFGGWSAIGLAVLVTVFAYLMVRSLLDRRT